MADDKKVMYDSDEAAKLVTITGWRSRHGRFYGDQEHVARWDGCTHRRCQCGVETDRYTVCEACREIKAMERYQAMPFKEWDGETPLTLADDDRYFFSEDDLVSYLDEQDPDADDVRLVICEPNYASEIDEDHFVDDLPPDQGLDEVYPELAAAIEKVNELIRKKEKPLSWGAGKYRTSYTTQPTESTGPSE